MLVRSIVIMVALAFGAAFGFVLSSCMTPPVDGQVTEFPPLVTGVAYQIQFSPAGPETGFAGGVLTEIGPYPWIEMESGDGFVLHVNLENVAYIAIETI